MLVLRCLVIALPLLVCQAQQWIWQQPTAIPNGMCGAAMDNTTDQGTDVGENTLTLACPAGVIERIVFASYGTPGGSCDQPTIGRCWLRSILEKEVLSYAT